MPRSGEVVACLRVLREVLIAVQSGVEIAGVQRGVDGGEPHRAAGAGVGEHALHRTSGPFRPRGRAKRTPTFLPSRRFSISAGIADLEQLLGGAAASLDDVALAFACWSCSLSWSIRSWANRLSAAESFPEIATPSRMPTASAMKTAASEAR